MNASVTRVAELIPPPEAVAPKDWAQVEQALGTQLPEDYKQLVDTFGGGVFDETVWLLEPGCSVPDYDLLSMAEERQEVLGNLWNHGEPKPAELETAGARLLPWAYAEEGGEFLYWLITPGQDPGTWPIMINEGRGPEWEKHPGPCAAFLLSLMTGETSSGTFPELPAEEHQFDPNTEILSGG